MSEVLSEVGRGETVRLAGVDADRRTVRRLAELGLTPGVALTVLQTSKGPILVAVRGARVAVGQETAAVIRVTADGDGLRA